MESDTEERSLNILKEDSRKALWMFALLNISAIVLFSFGEMVLPIVILIFQICLILFWILPTFIYHVVVKKIPKKLAFYKALGSYRDLVGQVSW